MMKTTAMRTHQLTIYRVACLVHSSAGRVTVADWLLLLLLLVWMNERKRTSRPEKTLRDVKRRLFVHGVENAARSISRRKCMVVYVANKSHQKSLRSLGSKELLYRLSREATQILRGH